MGELAQRVPDEVGGREGGSGSVMSQRGHGTLRWDKGNVSKALLESAALTVMELTPVVNALMSHNLLLTIVYRF